jgi:MFS family permease
MGDQRSYRSRDASLRLSAQLFEQGARELIRMPTSFSKTGESPKARVMVLGGMFHPFTVRNFRLLFGGQTVSTMGDALYAVALPWLILSNGGSPQELGIVLTAYGIPRVGSVLLGGWLSDRLHPRRVMLMADAVRAVLVGILALLAFWRQANAWELSAVAGFLGTFQGLFLPSASAMLPAFCAPGPDSGS